MRKFFHLTAAAAAVLLFSACADRAEALMNGPCSQCHTMHNSQDNQPMRYGGTSSEPLPQLLRGDCYGCHAMGVNQALFPMGVDVIPQVYHTDTVDLAGGNFKYVETADANGHNISDLWSVGSDAALNYAPPGGFKDTTGMSGDGHPGDVFSATEPLKCAGTRGCHGNRNSGLSGYEGINGAHHNNKNLAVDQPSTNIEPGQGYRFLLGVKGYEDTDWQYTKGAGDHNEYAGRTAPTQLDCSVTTCHTTGGIRPANGTMSEYCATCHGNFHTLSVGLGNDTLGNSAGIGTGAHPFLRHPSDLSIPATGDYANYTNYLTITPVARIGAPVGVSATVTPGTDAVFCLSCHVAHGSPYPDMLKWDYTTMQVGTGASNGTGCFACHRSK